MPTLRIAIEELASRVRTRELAKATEALSAAYRGSPDRPRPGGVMEGDAARIAYLVTRFPGTLAALSAAVTAVVPRLEPSAVRAAVELGAGPGPGVWALPAAFPALERIRLVDADHRMLAIARELAVLAAAPPSLTVETQVADLRSWRSEPADLVIVSYALGELAEADRPRIVQRAWEATRMALVLIEPGTSAGFARVRSARERLLSLGAHILAPCPHGQGCPMVEPDWCHFAARAERSRLHRHLKHGALGYEDEKFSYVVVDRASGTLETPSASRVIARPQRRPGWVQLALCTTEGLRHEVVSRRHGAAYRAARDAAWGAAWKY
jgi:ribosomal protein RSM22 (predicted rRNA methylase)